MSDRGLVGRNVEAYRRFTGRVLDSQDEAEAMALAIGASSVEEFVRTGQYEADLLVQSGLQTGHFLVDVGCGSGRLASRLQIGHTGAYLGTEISTQLLDYARRLVNRKDWQFVHVDGLIIPTPTETADMVCFFSVLTHLRHEESFLYLEEARRVLKPGGRIVFSFLDFSQPNHRVVFEATVSALRTGSDEHVNQFMSTDSIEVWADMLGLEVEHLYPGTTDYIELSASPAYQPGATHASLGQSVCVLRKP